MAKSKARRKVDLTVAQKITSVASLAMPEPLQRVLRNRIAALLFLLMVPVFLATGLATVSWENGMPKFSINKEKTEKAKEMAVQKIHEFRDEQFGSQPDAGPISSLRDRFDSHR
jgi:hypothetical protein